MTWRRFLMALVFCSPHLAVAQTLPSLELSFLPDAVEVSNVTEGGTVVWFAATQEIASDDVPEIYAYATTTEDDDRDGVGRFELEKGVPLHSTWVAVDLTTGASVAGSPEGYPLRSVAWKGAGLLLDEGGDSVADERLTGNLLVVRREVGAWFEESGDGGPADLDGAADGVLRLAIGALQPLGDTTAPPPTHLTAGDVVAMIDPRLLELTLVTIEK